MQDGRNPGTTGRWLFGALLVAELGWFAWLVLARRIPGGHDGFQYFSLQHYFLNERVTSGEIAQWLPFMTHGTVANWWYAVQAGLLQAALLAIGVPGIVTGSLALFHAGILVDRLLFLVGLWLLGGRLYRTDLARFMVAATALTSCAWITQPWYNLHFFYALPLTFWLIHRFLETAQWRWLALAACLSSLQPLGSLPYLVPITGFVVCLYGGSLAACRWESLRDRLVEYRPGPAAVLGIAAALVPAAGLLVVLSHGTGPIANYNPGRSLELTTTLEGYLGYAKNQNFTKWFELVLGFSPALDYSLFVGFLPLPLALAALGALRRENAHLAIGLVVLALVSVGSPVAALLYFCWPLIRYFRHLALVATVVKLFGILLVGVGFEAALLPDREGKAPSGRGMLVAALALGATGVGLLRLAGDLPGLRRLIDAMIVVELGLPKIELTDFHLRLRLLEAAGMALLTGVALAWWALVPAGEARRRPLAWLVVLHLAFMALYQVHEVRIRTGELTPEEAELLRFRPMPFARRRTLELDPAQPRYALVLRLPIRNVLYWSTQSFLFMDEAGSTWRADHWLAPLDELLRTYWHQDPLDRTAKPKGMVPYGYLEFPAGHPGALAAAGISEDRIQFFRQARAVGDDRAISQAMGATGWRGGNLFLSLPSDETLPGPTASGASSEPTSCPWEVTRFTSNHLEVTVEAPPGEAVWLYYADVWHPAWRATVDGMESRVYRANLAYKAVALHPGRNRVHFHFDLSGLAWIELGLGLVAVGWITMILGMSGAIMRDSAWGGPPELPRLSLPVDRDDRG